MRQSYPRLRGRDARPRIFRVGVAQPSVSRWSDRPLRYHVRRSNPSSTRHPIRPTADRPSAPHPRSASEIRGIESRIRRRSSRPGSPVTGIVHIAPKSEVPSVHRHRTNRKRPSSHVRSIWYLFRHSRVRSIQAQMQAVRHYQVHVILQPKVDERTASFGGHDPAALQQLRASGRITRIPRELVRMRGREYFCDGTHRQRSRQLARQRSRFGYLVTGPVFRSPGRQRSVWTEYDFTVRLFPNKVIILRPKPQLLGFFITFAP